MKPSFTNNRGNTLVTVTVVGAVAVTVLVGLVQLAANYSNQQNKERKAFKSLNTKEMALEFLKSKFMSRQMANGIVGTEWSIRNVANKVEVSAQSNYCYDYDPKTRLCSAKSDPQKVPIRDVYRRWQMINGQNLCALVTPYQEFTGAADPQVVCAPHYDEYEKDGSGLASIQTKNTSQGNEQQKAYISVVDLDKLSTSEQDQFLAGTLASSLLEKSLLPVRMTFSIYVAKVAPQPDEITVVFDDGDQAQIFVPKNTNISGPQVSCVPGMLKIQSSIVEQKTGGVLGSDVVYFFKQSDPKAAVVCAGNARVLVVGGGGGGGNAAGGGAGAVFESSLHLALGSAPVVVGEGGKQIVVKGDLAYTTDGSESSFLDLKAEGGGGAGQHCGPLIPGCNPVGSANWKNNNGRNGASGGGAAYNFLSYTFVGGRGTPGKGHDGAASTGWDNGHRGAGGGGGAGGPAKGMDGGIGIVSDITGVSSYYGGGGAAGQGGEGCIGRGKPGLGGGGSGSWNSCGSGGQTPGQPNTGGGGGSYSSGGSGVVIIRAIAPKG